MDVDVDVDGLCVGDGSFMNVRIKLNVNEDHIHIERSYCIFCNMISQYEYDLYLRSIISLDQSEWIIFWTKLI